MLERFDAGSGAWRHDGGSCKLTPDRGCAWESDLRLEREQCIARLREIAADGLFNCVAIPGPALFGARIKAPQIPLNFRKISAAELLSAAQLSRHER